MFYTYDIIHEDLIPKVSLMSIISQAWKQRKRILLVKSRTPTLLDLNWKRNGGRLDGGGSWGLVVQIKKRDLWLAMVHIIYWIELWQGI